MKPDLDRLRKVCGLLGSTHAGERSAAALKATEILSAMGLSWEQVISPVPSHSPLYAIHWQAEATAMRANADLFQALLEDERKRVNRLTREVARLKGMWPTKRTA